MKGLVFAKRTIKEILREPLSYIFCLGFPLLMLLLMSVLNESLPKEAGISLFALENLAPGTVYFGLTFIMIFSAIQIAGDRSTSLMVRLHASPMRAVDFIEGYTIPLFILGILQVCVTYAAAIILGIILKTPLKPAAVAGSMLRTLPSILLFASLGLLIGSIFNEKAAPGLCSVLVTVTGMLGGIWMPVDTLGGKTLAVSKALPFYYGVKAARTMDAKALIITITAAVFAVMAAVVVLGKVWKKVVDRKNMRCYTLSIAKVLRKIVVPFLFCKTNLLIKTTLRRNDYDRGNYECNHQRSIRCLVPHWRSLRVLDAGRLCNGGDRIYQSEERR